MKLKNFSFGFVSGTFASLVGLFGKLTFNKEIAYSQNTLLEFSSRAIFLIIMIYCNKLMLQTLLYNWKLNGATVGTALNFVTNITINVFFPFKKTFLGFYFFGEKISMNFVLGIFLILLGTLLLQSDKEIIEKKEEEIKSKKE